MAATSAKLLDSLHAAATFGSRSAITGSENELAKEFMCPGFRPTAARQQPLLIAAQTSTSSFDLFSAKPSLSKHSRARQVAAAAESAVEDRPASQTQAESAPIHLTYLEGNSWLFDVEGVSFLVDPIIESPLDFGIPWLYTAHKFVVRDMKVEEIPEVDYLLITQSLDDHCHLNTLRPLSKLRPNLPVLATPNAEPLLKDLFTNVTYLEPGESRSVTGANGVEVTVKATKGPVLGPPWQRAENGYILRSTQSDASVYLEPHCVFSDDLAQEDPVQVVVTPVIKQNLPAFTLVSGQEDAVKLCKLLKAKYVVPMANAELDASGLLAVVVKPFGSELEFLSMLQKELPETMFINAVPNKAVPIPPPK